MLRGFVCGGTAGVAASLLTWRVGLPAPAWLSAAVCLASVTLLVWALMGFRSGAAGQAVMVGAVPSIALGIALSPLAERIRLR